MKLEFHPQAEQEFNDAVDYYEECSLGLGKQLVLEIYAATDRIIAHPQAWPIIQGDIRRVLAHRFPYGLLYVVKKDVIQILAVMNLNRHPDYWKNRV